MPDAVTVTLSIGVGVILTVILRWKRNWIVLRTSPRELLLLATTAERNHAYGLGTLAFLKNRRTWVAFIGYSIPVIFLSAVMQELALDAARIRKSSFAELLLFLYSACGIVLVLIPLMFLRYRKWMRAFLRAYLNDHGILICLDCGYDLRGQIELRCPECGTVFYDTTATAPRKPK